MEASHTVPKTKILLRGLLNRCPKCGGGKLLQGYIKQTDACAACGEDFSTLRAQDGPAWLTILLTGHIMAPLIMYGGEDKTYSDETMMTALMTLTIIVAAFVLPRAKGLFIAVLWMLEKKNVKP